MSLQFQNPQRSSNIAAAQSGSPARWRQCLLAPAQPGKVPGAAGSLEQAEGSGGILAELALPWPEAGQGLSWPLGKVFL
jgi:hypothetical protein